MTIHRPAPDADTFSPTARYATGYLAVLSGGALVIDTVTIAVINRAFDPLDSILFMVGFVGLWLTDIALAIHLSAGRHGARRLLVGIASFIAFAAVLGVVSTVFDQLGRHLFTKSNIGLHGEWSFFSIGICLLILAAWTLRQGRTPPRDGGRTAPVRRGSAERSGSPY